MSAMKYRAVQVRGYVSLIVKIEDDGCLTDKGFEQQAAALFDKQTKDARFWCEQITDVFILQDAQGVANIMRDAHNDGMHEAELMRGADKHVAQTHGEVATAALNTAPKWARPEKLNDAMFISTSYNEDGAFDHYKTHDGKSYRVDGDGILYVGVGYPGRGTYWRPLNNRPMTKRARMSKRYRAWSRKK